MKKLLPLFLLVSSALFAQTGTFTAYGYGLCQNSAPIQKALYCTVTLYRNGSFSGYFTFFAENDYTPNITSGQVWRFNSSDTQTGHATNIIGTIDTSNKVIAFKFTNGAAFSGNATLGYKIQKGFCNRYCHPSRVVITAGVVHFSRH